MDSLIGLGVNQDDVFSDKASGSKTERPGLIACLAKLQQGGTLIVWRLDMVR
jgi:DNA invertase Pin-like site-specific DNA recombinase